jgi:hypothetical protein
VVLARAVICRVNVSTYSMLSYLVSLFLSPAVAPGTDDADWRVVERNQYPLTFHTEFHSTPHLEGSVCAGKVCLAAYHASFKPTTLQLRSIDPEE